MSRLTGKVAVVTGASKGIGAAIAKALAAEGASVVVNYASSKSGADDVVRAIAKSGGRAVAVQGDVAKATDAQAIIDAAIKNYGRMTSWSITLASMSSRQSRRWLKNSSTGFSISTYSERSLRRRPPSSISRRRQYYQHWFRG